MKAVTHGLTRVDKIYRERSYFRGAKSHASPSQLVRTGWRTCSFSKCVFRVSLSSLQALKCARRAKRARAHACHPPWPISMAQLRPLFHSLLVHRAGHVMRSVQVLLQRVFDHRSCIILFLMMALKPMQISRDI